MDLDTTIQDVERLYRTVTGGMEPSSDATGAAIPPEKDPQEFVGEQVARLNSLLAQHAPLPPAWSPAVGVWEAAKEFVVSVDLPGVARKSIALSTSGAELIIQGTRSSPLPDLAADVATPRWAEQRSGPFERRVLLPPHSPVASVSARLRDGVLEVRLAKGSPGEGGTGPVRQVEVG